MPTLLQWYMLPVCLDSSLALCIPHFYSLSNLFKCLHLKKAIPEHSTYSRPFCTPTFNSVGFPLSFTRMQTSEKNTGVSVFVVHSSIRWHLLKTCNYCLVLISWTLKFRKRRINVYLSSSLLPQCPPHCMAHGNLLIFAELIYHGMRKGD